MASKHLNEELTEEILVKLPVKSLIRFKCLSKGYGTLITSERFITKHLSCSTLATGNKSNLLLFHYQDKFAMTLVPDNESSQPPIDLISQFPFNHDLLDSIIAYGPSNGIFCLEVGLLKSPDKLMLWNPATREVKDLPLTHIVDCSMWNYVSIVHGFGFDTRSNDYKVVNIVVGGTHGEEEGQRPYGQVYNLSTNSWKMVDVAIHADRIDSPTFTSYVNGVYHWLAKSVNDEFVLCFDMSNDIFFRMNLPSVSHGNTNERGLLDSNLGIFNDSVVYIKEYTPTSLVGTLVEIWLMNEYGVEESWTKRFNIGPWVERWKFWGFWKDDEVLLVQQDDESLVSYNVDTQQPVKVFPVNVGLLDHAFRYEESIVSLSRLVVEEP